jgi:glycosyltransferase involved in cell wall biosynthesis
VVLVLRIRFLNMPTVSVIVPNYNHARFLRRRIESVLGQTYGDFEVILLDDCSTDDSQSILRENASDPRVRIEFNEKNSGSTFKQWNKGVRLARGEYVWIAESDDYADERFLERLVGVLEAEPEVTFVYCRSRRVTEDDREDGFGDFYLDALHPQRWKADFRANGREECRLYFVSGNSVPNASCAVFRKAIYERVGGADERLRVCGDWKLWVTMAFDGRVAYLAEPLNYYRTHNETVRSRSERTGLVAAEHLAMVRWMLKRVKPPEAVMERAYFLASIQWIPAVLSRRVPLRRRLRLLWDAVAIDPHAVRKLVRPTLAAVRLKLAKEFRLIRQRFEGRAS